MVANTITEQMMSAGKRLLEKLDVSGFPLEAALWLYFSEDEAWKLVLAFSDVGKQGPKFYYEKVQRAISKLKESEGIALDDVVLARPDAPVIRLLKSAVLTGPGITGIRFANNVINGRLVEDAYIYKL
jgi:hypothetical protein